MGCACTGGSQIEQFLTDFIEELNIVRTSDKTYMQFINETNPFNSQDRKLERFLNWQTSGATSSVREHEKYRELMMNHPRQYLCVALLLLTQTNSLSNMSTLYLTLIDKLKNKFIESTSTRLEDLYNSDYEVFKVSLLFYCNMVSYHIVDACMTVGKYKITEDQANQLRSIYSAEVIELFVKDLLKGCDVVNFNHEDFFKRNYVNLHHTVVRDRLRKIWNTKFFQLSQRDQTMKTGKIYTLNNNVENTNIVEKVESVNLTNDAPQLVSSGAKISINMPNMNFGGNSYTQQTNQTSYTNKTYISSSSSSNNITYGGSSLKEIQFGGSGLGQIQMGGSNIDISSLLLSSGKPTQAATFEIGESSLTSLKDTSLINELICSPYIDPLNNATNKFLYGREIISSEDVKNLPSKQFMILKKFRRDCLAIHNDIRKSHQVADLVEDALLDEKAQSWANYIAETDNLTHSTCDWNGKIVGENIAKGSAVLEEPVKLVCGKWYSEFSNYSFTNPGTEANTKNFTQMVWKNSQQVGFGLAYSKSGNTYVVVNYYPAGNISSELRENVFPSTNTL